MKFFDATFYEIFGEGLIGSLRTVLKMAYIVVPLMIILEIAKYYKLIDKVSSFFAPFLSKIGLDYNATFPLLVGVILGITYGSGVMIDSVEKGEINKREVSLILVFLVICHAIFEDCFVFWSIGSNFFILFFGRIIGAIIITGIFSKIMKEEQLGEIQKIEHIENNN